MNVHDVIHRVHAWVNKEGENWLSHASREMQFRDALTHGQITEAEYEAAKRYYGGYSHGGGLWNYVGD